jgi:RNA polymerase-binding transcription factor DksA
MAGGWSRDGAVQDQIEDSVKDAVLAARARLAAAASAAEGETHCVECGEEIPEGRRRALPGGRG